MLIVLESDITDSSQDLLLNCKLQICWW